MQAPTAVAADRGAARILSVSPLLQDHKALEELLSNRQWKIVRAFTCNQAGHLLQSGLFSLVISERDLTPGSWKDVLLEIGAVRNPPFLIVTSSHADDRLWSEALNLGAYDVLVKPFDGTEVMRSLDTALLHRRFQIRFPQRHFRTQAS